jgi:hypothetical protein
METLLMNTPPLLNTPTPMTTTNPAGTLEWLRRQVRQGQLTPERRQALQHELAQRSTPAQRAELDALLRHLPAAETADVRDLLYR